MTMTISDRTPLVGWFTRYGAPAASLTNVRPETLTVIDHNRATVCSDAKCGKCNGFGTYYSWNTGGDYPCSQCGGSGTTYGPRKLYTEARIDELEKKLKGDKFKPLAERLSNFVAQNREKHGDKCVDMLLNYEGQNDFVLAAKRKLDSQLLSDKFLAGSTNAILREEEQAKEKQEAGPVPSGRIEVEGVVISTKFKSNPYAYGEQIKQMLVKLPNGSKIFGTVPKAIAKLNKTNA